MCAPRQASSEPGPTAAPTGDRALAERQTVLVSIDRNVVARREFASQYAPGQRVFDMALDRSAKGPCPKHWVVSLFDQPLLRGISQRYSDLVLLEPHLHLRND